MNKTLIFADRLLDGQNPTWIETGGLMISEDVIQWVGEKARAPESSDKTVRNFPGCTILPGLVDAHVHLSMMGTSDPWSEMQQDSPPKAALKAARNAHATLLSGVTTVRDLGSKEGVVIKVAEAVEEGLIVGSRILPAGRCIVMTGGHGYAIGVEVDGESEARKAAREEMKAGAQVLKLMATGGVLTPGVEPGSPQLTIEEMRAVTEEAHKAGRKVAAHAHGCQGIKNAILAGVDTVEHCSYLDAEAIDLFHEKGATMVSTLLATMLLIWNLENAKLPSYVVEKIIKHVDHEVASLEMAINAGVKIAAGTDAGSGVNPHNQFLRQLELLAKHGMTEMEAIQAGTRISAETLGLAEKIGTLEPGKFADILIVRGNPLTDLQAVGDIVAVIKQGKWIADESIPSAH
jgi:imidazolonepropionase-like amidohydrolase